MSIAKDLNVDIKSRDETDIRSITTMADGTRSHRKQTHRLPIRKGPVRPAILYQPTYRLESQNPFNYFVGEKIIEAVFQGVLGNFRYTPKAAINTAKGLSQEIRSRLTKCNFNRYRFICLVSIGEKLSQTFCHRMKALWDSELDSYATYVYDHPNFYAVGLVLAVYYE